MANGKAPQEDGDWGAVAEAVKARLEDQRLTQMGAATKAGVALATIQELVAGVPRRRQPRTLTAISEALGWPAGRISEIALGLVPTGENTAEVESETLGGEIRAIREELRKINQRLDAI